MSKKKKRNKPLTAFGVVAAMAREQAQRELLALFGVEKVPTKQLEAMQCERQARMAAYDARKAAETFKPAPKPELSTEQQIAVKDLLTELTMYVNSAVVEFERWHPEIGLYACLSMDAHIHENCEATE